MLNSYKEFINFCQQITSTLRGKLSLWHIASVSVIILAFLTASTFLLWATIKNQIDHHLHIVVNEAAQIVETQSGNQREELLRSFVSAQGMTIVLLSPDGSAILETNSPDIALITEHELQGIMSVSSLYEATPVHFTQRDIRFAAKPVEISAGKGILAVGYSTQILYATVTTMIQIVVGIIVLLVLPLTFLGHKLLGKYLRPLESIANQAQAIGDSSALSRRIQTKPDTQELASITNAFNHMLAKLESVFENERAFFSDTAHTLKTPLTVLRFEAENSTLAQKVKSKILDTIDVAAETIQDLLLLAKIGNKTQAKKVFSLSDLLQNLSELTATLGEKKAIKVAARIPKNVKVVANKKLLNRALSNVLHNAVAYNKRGGRIDLTLEQNQDNLVITIKDTGHGIKKSDQKKLFTRFFRGSSSASQAPRGSGLGLAIAAAVIKDCSGTIDIRSVPGKQTTVVIKLPKPL